MATTITITIVEMIMIMVVVSESTTINVNPQEHAARFDGHGGVSGGGGGTRLLYDYSDEPKSEILDLLFKPKYGASLQILKVEVGCDGDTTQGSEQSHMRTPDDKSPTAFDRGYENWFMVEAKRRNKDIHLSGLEWGVPGWVAEPWVEGTIESTLTIASTDECTPLSPQPVQQFTFDFHAPGQLCNANGHCLNVPDCAVTASLIMFTPSAPGQSCVERCGCTKESGKTCGVGANDLDCYKNEQFTLNCTSDGCLLKNPINNYCVGESSDNTVKLIPMAQCTVKNQGWVYNNQTKELKSVSSGRCLGRWQNPPPPPPAPPNQQPRASTQRNIDYLIAWIKGLATYKNVSIDSIGVGYNEGAFNITWIKEIKQQLSAAGLGHVLTIGTDDCCGGEYNIAKTMATDPVLNASIDILGAHCVGVQNGQKNPTPEIIVLQKPLWNTEQHFGLPDPSPAVCWQFDTALQLAQTLNQQYVVSNQTSVQMWTPIYSWYDYLNYVGKGLMVANRPWDGSYNVSDTIWVIGHTTQFTERGWYYLGDGGCGLLAGAGSYVSLASPSGDNVSIIIETVGANTSQAITIHVQGLAHVQQLSCWTTIEGAVFQQQAPVPVGTGGEISITVPPNSVWTLSTTTEQQKGGSSIPQRPLAPLALPYTDDFESYAEDTLARYFSDMHGSFAVYTEPTTGNKVLRQQADVVPPLSTHGRGAKAYSVVVGDGEWSGYTLRTMVKTPSNQTQSQQQLQPQPNYQPQSQPQSQTQQQSQSQRRLQPQQPQQQQQQQQQQQRDADDVVISSQPSFVFIGSHAGNGMGSLHPEVFFHPPFIKNQGVVLQLAMDGTWLLLLGGSSGSSKKGSGGAWKAGEWSRLAWL